MPIWSMAGLSLLAALTAGCSCGAAYATTSSERPAASSHLSSRLSTLVGKSERYGAMSPSVDFGVDLRHTGGQNVDSGEVTMKQTDRTPSQPSLDNIQGLT